MPTIIHCRRHSADDRTMAKPKENPMKTVIGIIGLGKMGTAIAERLSGQGFQIEAWTRRGVDAGWAAKTGVTGHNNLETLVERADIALLSLSDDQAVSSVLERLLELDLQGRLIVDCSTVNPAILASFTTRINAAGAQLLDAPISGWPIMVAQGKAGIYIGGQASDVERFLPIAEAMSNRIHHVGPLGHGMAAKIVNNMMLASYWQCLREALQVGKSAGLSDEKMLEILTGSPAANGVLALKVPVILGEITPPSFTVSGIVADLAMFDEVAKSAGVDVPSLRAALMSFTQHEKTGAGEEDFVSMVAAALKDSQMDSIDVL